MQVAPGRDVAKTIFAVVGFVLLAGCDTPQPRGVSVSDCRHSEDRRHRLESFSALITNRSGVEITLTEISYDVGGFESLVFSQRIRSGGATRIVKSTKNPSGDSDWFPGLGLRPCELWTVIYADGSKWQQHRQPWP